MSFVTYITALEIANDEGVKATLQAEDVCWAVTIKDTIHTAESWDELADAVRAAIGMATAHNEAEDAAAKGQS